MDMVLKAPGGCKTEVFCYSIWISFSLSGYINMSLILLYFIVQTLAVFFVHFFYFEVSQRERN